MGIAETEQKILEELQQLSNEPEQDKKDSEELLQEVTGETKEEEEVDENSEEEDSKEEEEVGEEVEEEDPEEPGEDPEEEKGAKLRHKRKAEKEALQTAQREAFELRERIARLEGRAEATAAPALPPETPKAEEIPDEEYEPDKYAIYEAKQARNEAKQARDEIKELKAEQSRISAERSWENMQTEHAKANPDYSNAKEFLIKHETEKLKTQHPYATDAQIAQAIKQGEYEEAGNAAKAGVLPTKHIEFLAYQAGYRTESVQAPKQKPNIKQIKKNAKKNASLIGGSSAGETGDGRTAQQLLDMTLDDIHKFGRDKYKKAVQKLEARIA